MSEPKWTKWEWEDPVPLTNGCESRCLVDADGRPVIRHEAKTWSVSDANAHLIAASPALADVAEFVVALAPILDGYDMGGLVVKARAALALAKGGV